MADFMGNHVGLGEVARRLEALAQIAVERQVDINFAIGATVERACRRLGKAAGRLDGVRKKHQGRFLIGTAGRLEDITPRPLGAPEYPRDELPHLVLTTGLRLWRRTLWNICFLQITLQQQARIDAKVERDQNDDDGADTAAGDTA